MARLTAPSDSDILGRRVRFVGSTGSHSSAGPSDTGTRSRESLGPADREKIAGSYSAPSGTVRIESVS